MTKVPEIDWSRAGDLYVVDEQDARHRLADLWKAQRAVLVFVRHFG